MFNLKYCYDPKGDILMENESYHTFFQDMREISGFKGFVGYSIRELNNDERKIYCESNSIPTVKVKLLPLIKNQINFTANFMILTYTSGCYYYDSNNGKWSSHGVEIQSETNLKQVHCSSLHLTSFPGGLQVIPSAINFELAFSNASFIQNATIYVTVIISVIVYILFSIWARYMDTRDLKKLNIIFMKDNGLNHSYFYEIMVFTGNRDESGTQSKVKFWDYIIKFSGSF